MSTARTTVSFIGLVRNYLTSFINHHTTTFLKLPSVLHQQPQRLIRQMPQWPVRDAVGYVQLLGRPAEAAISQYLVEANEYTRIYRYTNT